MTKKPDSSALMQGRSSEHCQTDCPPEKLQTLDQLIAENERKPSQQKQ
ncbi:hypothetical protein KKJ12_19255 [Xenorhabdus bovienii]|nr:hypothetical protein [Xenorhabdus bovienii]MDE9474990.1 hypothetical protein [Xenorhabdus bovienii]